jgi:phage tail sheath gpL-like
MASSIVITIESEETQAAVQQKYQDDSDRPREQALALASLFKQYASMHERAEFTVQTASAAPVAASGTWTLDTVVATDTVTVAGVTFTGTDTPTTVLHFDTSSADVEVIAADIARAVNEHTTANLYVTASADAEVVTVTAKQKGVVGNLITFTDGDSTITSSGSGFLAGGTGGASEDGVTYTLGI